MADDNFPNTLAGFEVRESVMLVGSKTGIVQGNVLIVSPAYASLLRSAKTQSDLLALLQSLKVLHLPLFNFTPSWTKPTYHREHW